MEERMLIALFLCSHQPDEVLKELKPEWDEKIALPFNEKLSLINHKFSIRDIFPWQNELSEGVDPDRFIESFFIQPDLFIRIRPGHAESVKQKLGQAKLRFEIISDTCLALPNASRIDEIIELDKEAVVQDYSSQRVGGFIDIVNKEFVRRRLSDEFRAWDCCAASGGKSIMLKDLLGGIDLIVSDVRESILLNLEKRFVTAGIMEYESFVADLSKPLSISLSSFNLIIADVPCTGSGTWSRTPEQLYYFQEEKTGVYAALQQKIVSTVIPHLEPGGYLLYITCSVFKMENEEAVAFIKEKFHLQELKMELIKGYDKKADSMFACLLQKPL